MTASEGLSVRAESHRCPSVIWVTFPVILSGSAAIQPDRWTGYYPSDVWKSSLSPCALTPQSCALNATLWQIDTIHSLTV